MVDSITGPVLATVPIYSSAEPAQGKKEAKKKTLGNAEARITVYAHEKVVMTKWDGYRNRLACDVRVEVRAKGTNQAAGRVEEKFVLEHREAEPYLKASTQFPSDCSLYTLTINRPTDPNQIAFSK